MNSVYGPARPIPQKMNHYNYNTSDIKSLCLDANTLDMPSILNPDTSSPAVNISSDIRSERTKNALDLQIVVNNQRMQYLNTFFWNGKYMSDQNRPELILSDPLIQITISPEKTLNDVIEHSAKGLKMTKARYIARGIEAGAIANYMMVKAVENLGAESGEADLLRKIRLTKIDFKKFLKGENNVTGFYRDFGEYIVDVMRLAKNPNYFSIKLPRGLVKVIKRNQLPGTTISFTVVNLLLFGMALDIWIYNKNSRRLAKQLPPFKSKYSSFDSILMELASSMIVREGDKMSIKKRVNPEIVSDEIILNEIEIVESSK